MNVADFRSYKRSPDTKSNRCCMREVSEFGTFNTAPYKEWLGVVGSRILAALIYVVLLAGGLS